MFRGHDPGSMATPRDSQDWLSHWIWHPSPRFFSEVLILKGFKSFVLEVLIPQELRRHFGELRITNELGAIFA